MSGHVDRTDTAADFRRRVDTARRQGRDVVSVSVDVATIMLKAYDGDIDAQAEMTALARRLRPWEFRE